MAHVWGVFLGCFLAQLLFVSHLPSFSQAAGVTFQSGTCSGGSQSNLSLNENSPIGTQIFVFNISSGSPIDRVVFVFPNGSMSVYSHDSRFSFNVNKLSNAMVLDFESATLPPVATYSIKAFDIGGDFASCNITISVLDVNEPPLFSPADGTVSWPVDTALNTVLATLHAVDPDNGANGLLQYYINSVTPFSSFSSFRIVGNGVLLNGPVMPIPHTLLIFAADTGTPSLSTVYRLVISFTNSSSNNPPVFFSPLFEYDVSYDAGVGSTFGIIGGADGDSTFFNVTLSGPYSSYFLLNSSAAPTHAFIRELTLIRALKRGIVPSTLDFLLTVTDGTNEGHALLTINLVDPPVPQVCYNERTETRGGLWNESRSWSHARVPVFGEVAYLPPSETEYEVLLPVGQHGEVHEILISQKSILSLSIGSELMLSYLAPSITTPAYYYGADSLTDTGSFFFSFDACPFNSAPYQLTLNPVLSNAGAPAVTANSTTTIIYVDSVMKDFTYNMSIAASESNEFVEVYTAQIRLVQQSVCLIQSDSLKCFDTAGQIVENVFSSCSSLAANSSTISSWDDPASWTGNEVPQDGELVQIPSSSAEHGVALNQGKQALVFKLDIGVNGGIYFDTESTLFITASTSPQFSEPTFIYNSSSSFTFTFTACPFVLPPFFLSYGLDGGDVATLSSETTEFFVPGLTPGLHYKMNVFLGDPLTSSSVFSAEVYTSNGLFCFRDTMGESCVFGPTTTTTTTTTTSTTSTTKKTTVTTKATTTTTTTTTTTKKTTTKATTTTSTATTEDIAGAASSSSSSNPAIIPAVAGGAALLILLAVLIVVFLRRRRNQRRHPELEEPQHGKSDWNASLYDLEAKKPPPSVSRTILTLEGLPPGGNDTYAEIEQDNYEEIPDPRKQSSKENNYQDTYEAIPDNRTQTLFRKPVGGNRVTVEPHYTFDDAPLQANPGLGHTQSPYVMEDGERDYEEPVPLIKSIPTKPEVSFGFPSSNEAEQHNYEYSPLPIAETKLDQPLQSSDKQESGNSNPYILEDDYVTPVPLNETSNDKLDGSNNPSRRPSKEILNDSNIYMSVEEV